MREEAKNVKYSFEVSEADHNEVSVDFNPNLHFPEIPRKPCCCATSLLFIGIILLILGFVEEYTYFEDPSRGIAFWVLGCLTIIPGGYFSYYYLRACRAKTPMERMNVLKSIPEME